LTKKEIAHKVALATGITNKKAKQIVDVFIKEISRALVAGSKIELRGFGVFTCRESKGKIARNLQTNEQIPIPPYHRIKFIPGKRLKEIINMA
jgi:nucleoid DNA-binding protein